MYRNGHVPKWTSTDMVVTLLHCTLTTVIIQNVQVTLKHDGTDGTDGSGTNRKCSKQHSHIDEQLVSIPNDNC